VDVPDTATLADLKAAIESAHAVPAAQVRLAADPGLLTSKEPEAYPELVPDPAAPLSSLGIAHGALLHMWYPFSRDVDRGRRPDLGEGRDFGAKLTVRELVDAQVRIARQDAPTVAALSLDRGAADAFQAYVARATRFGVARCGLLYGRVGEDGCILANGQAPTSSWPTLWRPAWACLKWGGCSPKRPSRRVPRHGTGSCRMRRCAKWRPSRANWAKKA
jgi:hypothetical protein